MDHRRFPKLALCPTGRKFDEGTAWIHGQPQQTSQRPVQMTRIAAQGSIALPA